MPLPKVAIVGRPNVGKSSLFNMLARRRIAIVEPTAGVTRDRVSTIIEYKDRWFELMDTGGMDFRTSAELAADVQRQIDLALKEAAVILFEVDVQDGRTPLDEEIAQRLRPITAPILMVANKADNERMAMGASDFHALGYEPILPVSSKHSRGRYELLAAILDRLPAEAAEPPAEVAMKIAVVGKRNAGKSTFINALAGAERVIVSEIPGTTRDAIDVRIEKDGLTYTVIDTAGVRKRKSIANDIEFYSLTRAMDSVLRADVILFLLDAPSTVSQVDKQLGSAIQSAAKPVVLVVSKWDTAKGKATTGDFADYFGKVLPGLSYAPIACVTAKESKNVLAVVDLARSLYKQAATRVTTGDLNRVMENTLRLQQPPSPGAKMPKVYYATQVAVCPPTIVLFVNDPDVFSEDYRRFIEHRFREELPFAEVPIRLILRAHAEEHASASARRAATQRGGPKRRGGRKPRP
jgi:GTPase